MQPVTVTSGSSPLMLAMPHTGTRLPGEIHDALNQRGRQLTDTDWHIDRLYDGLLPDATIVRANFHRYAIDANRDPSGASLYPGQNTTGLVPLTDFDGLPIWLAGREPGLAEIERRTAAFHAPYHAALDAQLQRIKQLHGHVVLFDCHSIRSQIPFLFEGVLPDFNIGTNNGSACAPQISGLAVAVCLAASNYSHVLNGRFKGGWTTRHYGQPYDGVHAIQMELAQSTHLATQSPPFAYDREKSEKLRGVLAKILEGIAGWSPNHA